MLVECWVGVSVDVGMSVVMGVWVSVGWVLGSVKGWVLGWMMGECWDGCFDVYRSECWGGFMGGVEIIPGVQIRLTFDLDFWREDRQTHLLKYKCYLPCQWEK